MLCYCSSYNPQPSHVWALLCCDQARGTSAWHDQGHAMPGWAILWPTNSHVWAFKTAPLPIIVDTMRSTKITSLSAFKTNPLPIIVPLKKRGGFSHQLTFRDGFSLLLPKNSNFPQTFSMSREMVKPPKPSSFPYWYDFYFPLPLSNIWSLHLVWPTSMCTIHLYILKRNLIQ